MKDLLKPLLLWAIAAILFPSSVSAQNLDYGVKLIYNSSSHTNFDPTIPENGEFQWNALGTFGAGAYASKRLHKHFISSLSLLYQQKGYREFAQIGATWSGAGFVEPRLRNTFNYLSADAQLQFVAIHGGEVDVSIAMGIEYNYLLDYTIQSDFNPINQSYPVNAYQDQWEKNSWSVIPSVMLNINQVTTLEFGFNRSITPVLETENLLVKDWIWTVRAGVSVPGMFK